jgi:hypothetical protein
MIGGPGPTTPNLLRPYELGAVPKEMAEEKDEAHEPRDAEAKGSKRTRRRWWRFGRRQH